MALFKRNQILKIVVHILILGIVISPSLSMPMPRPGEEFNLFNFSLTNILILIVYIINVIYLIPKFIYHRKYLKYTASILILIGIFLLPWVFQHKPYLMKEPPFLKEKQAEIHMLQEYLRDNTVERTGQEFSTIFSPPQKPFFLFMFIPYLLRFLVLMGLGTSVELVFLYEREKRKYDEMEKEKAIGELNFLRSQLNPHFLFNALNNIYSLARKKSVDTTHAILLLSDMLRYVLYDSGKNKITLQEEVGFIKNYIELEKLKFTKTNSPKISFRVDIQNPDFLIEPLLFFTLVENAFKHGVSYMSRSFLHILLEEKNKEIMFTIINSKPTMEYSSMEKKDSGGVGIENLRKRMELLYPGKYSFKQFSEASIFKSYLTIKK